MSASILTTERSGHEVGVREVDRRDDKVNTQPLPTINPGRSPHILVIVWTPT